MMTEMLLDDVTERAIETFGAAKWKHGRRGATDEVMAEVERHAEALRSRIRELVEEARKEGYESDKPFFVRRDEEIDGAHSGTGCP